MNHVMKAAAERNSLLSVAMLAVSLCSFTTHAERAPVPSMSPQEITYISPISVASVVGAALDSDILKGGGSDDTVVLQRVLDRAASGKPVHLIVDGPALVSGLSIHGNTTIECTAGGGFYLKNNSAGAILRNAHRSRDTVTDKNIKIRGCFFNGNRNGQQPVGPEKSPYRHAQAADGSFRSALQFFGVQYLEIENVVLWNTRTFAVQIGNAKFLSIRNAIVDTAIPPYPDQASYAEQRKWRETYPSNDDGFHFHGPIQYLTMDGVKLRTWDDGISFTANEWGVDDITIGNEMGPYVGQGAITDVTVSNVVFMDAHHGIRVLSSDQRVDRILIQNVTGTIRERMAVVSHFLCPSRGNFGSIIFSNINVGFQPHPTWGQLYPERASGGSTFDSGEEGELPLFSLNAVIENLVLNNVVASPIDSRPLIRIGRDSAIKNMKVDLIVHDRRARAEPIKLVGRVERLTLALNWQGKEPIEHAGGSVGDLQLVNGGHQAVNRRE